VSNKANGKTQRIENKSFIEHEGRLYEQIFDNNYTAFATWDGEKVDYADCLEVYGTTVYPFHGEELGASAVLLPSEPKAYASEKQLAQDIQGFIHSYVDISPTDENLFARYVMMTYVYDRLGTVCYLRFRGDSGTGKSRALQVIGDICYKPIKMAGAATPAPIYRMITRYKGTLIVDEADWSYSNEKSELVKILNCGFEESSHIIRCDPDHPDTVHTFNVFGPKVIATRHNFSDSALESRCYTTIMEETERKLPTILTSRVKEEQQLLRNQLLMYRFKNWHSMELTELELPISNKRARQVFLPLAQMYKSDDDAFSKFAAGLQEREVQLVEENAVSYEGLVVNALVQLIDEHIKDINCSAIAERIDENNGNSKKTEFTAARVGKILRSLKIMTKQKKVNMENKRVVIPEKGQMEKLTRKYVPKYTDEEVSGNTSNTSGAAISGTKLVKPTLKFSAFNEKKLSSEDLF